MSLLHNPPAREPSTVHVLDTGKSVCSEHVCALMNTCGPSLCLRRHKRGIEIYHVKARVVQTPVHVLPQSLQCSGKPA